MLADQVFAAMKWETGLVGRERDLVMFEMMMFLASFGVNTYMEGEGTGLMYFGHLQLD